MGIQLPEWARKVFLITTGDGWPEADEDALLALSREWERLGTAVDELQVRILDPVRSVRRTDWDGPAAQAFALANEAMVAAGDSPIRQLSAGSRQMADFVHDTGVDVQYMKIIVLEELVLLAAQIAYLLSVAYTTFGASTAPAAALATAGRSFAVAAVRQLVIAIGTGQIAQISLDAAAQFAQLQTKMRRRWDTTLTESAAITGAISAAAGPLVHGVGSLAAHQVSQLVGRRTAQTVQAIGVDAGHEYLTSGLTGVTTGQGWVGSMYDLTAGATSGAVSAGADLMRHRQQGAGLPDDLALKASQCLDGAAAPVRATTAPAAPEAVRATTAPAAPEAVLEPATPVSPEAVPGVVSGPLPERAAVLAEPVAVDAAPGITADPAPADPAIADPAIVSPDPVSPPPVPPPRLQEHGRLSADDIVLGCYLPAVPAWQTLTAQLAPHLGSALNRLEPLLRTHLSSATLRTQLISMVRGDPWIIEINQNGLRGTIALDVSVDAVTWDRNLDKLEFEGGAHGQVELDSTGDVGWRHNRGLVLRSVAPGGRYALGLGGFRDNRWAASSTLAGRAYGTHETSEPTAVWKADATVRLKIDLSNGAERVRPPDIHIDAGIRFATPIADSVGTDGQLPAPTRHYAPPQRVQQGGRLGSTDVVVDLYPLPALPSPGKPTDGEATHGGEFPLDQLDDAGRHTYGHAWAAVRKELLPQLRLAMLHQQLKSMMSGQPFSIPLASVAGQIDVTAGVTELRHVRPMAEPSVFCVGSEVRREVELRRVGTTGMEVSGSTLIDEVDSTRYSVAGQGQIGRERDSQQGVHSRSGTVARITAPGEVFDGVAELRFALRRDGLVSPVHAQHTVPVGFRTIVERAEAVPTEQPTPWRRGETVPQSSPDAGPTSTSATDAGPEPTSATDAGPEPGRAWRGADGGLPETTVVTDLADVDTIRAAVEEAGQAAFGPLTWPELRHRVLGAFHGNLLTALIPAMTRGHVCQGPDLNSRGLPRSSAVAVTADLVSLRYRRQVASQLVSTNERTLRHSEQHGTSWSAEIAGASGTTLPTTDDLAALRGVGVEVRRRVGTGRQAAGKTLNNARTTMDLAIFNGEVQLTVTCTGAVGSTSRQVRVPVEVALPMSQAAVPVGDPAAPVDPAPVIRPPDRLLREGRLGAFDVVRNLAAHPSVVADAVAARVGERLGATWQTARNQVNAGFDLQALRPNLAALTTGDTVDVPVNGLGWSGQITLRARVGELAYQETFKDNVFEGGTHAGSMTSSRVEAASRSTVSAGLNGAAPHVKFNAALGFHRGQGHGTVTQSSGRVIATHRTKESAALFAGTVHFTAEFALRRLGVSIHVDDVQVDVPVELLVRKRDTVVDSGLNLATAPASQREEPILPPTRVRETRRLSGADVVLDVTPPLLHSGSRSHGMADILDAGDSNGRRMYGRSWPAVRAAILAEVDLARLKQELRPMMAGQPIIVNVPDGRVLITARLGTIHHEGGTDSTQFNSGTERGLGLVHFERTNGTALSANAQATVTTDPASTDPPIAAVAGLGGTVAAGNDVTRVGAVTAVTGISLRSREPGEIFTGLAVLDVRFERTTRSGGVQASIACTPVRYTALIRSLDLEAASPANDAVVPDVVRVPPARVWSREPGTGLSDTDVVHGLPDTGGIRQALDLHGRDLFGRKTWRQIGGVVLDTVNNAQLTAHLAGMTRGESLVSPPLLTKPGDPSAGVTVTASLVQLRYLGQDAKADLSVINETTDRNSYGRQHWWTAGAQAHSGVQGEVLGAKIIGTLNIGTARRSRDGVRQTVTGLTANDAIYREPAARYEGYVSVTATLHRGDQKRSFTGLAPVELSIPLAETVAGESGQSRVFERDPRSQAPKTAVDAGGADPQIG